MVDLELISARRAELAAHEAETTGRATEEVLLESRALSGNAYARGVAERAGLDHVDLSLFRADLAAVNLIPVATARRHLAVPVGFDESGHLLVAMASPQNLLALDDLRLLTGLPPGRPIDDVGARGAPRAGTARRGTGPERHRSRPAARGQRQRRLRQRRAPPLRGD